MASRSEAAKIACPACLDCGGPTRFLAASPHPRISQTDVRIFRCERCDKNQELVVPYAKAIPAAGARDVAV